MLPQDFESDPELDELIEKCRGYMFRNFWISDGKLGGSDYDIHVAVLGVEGDFTILMSMAVRPNTMYEFSREKKTTQIQVTNWVKAYVHSPDDDDF